MERDQGSGPPVTRNRKKQIEIDNKLLDQNERIRKAFMGIPGTLGLPVNRKLRKLALKDELPVKADNVENELLTLSQNSPNGNAMLVDLEEERWLLDETQEQKTVVVEEVEDIPNDDTCGSSSEVSNLCHGAFRGAVGNNAVISINSEDHNALVVNAPKLVSVVELKPDVPNAMNNNEDPSNTGGEVDDKCQLDSNIVRISPVENVGIKDTSPCQQEKEQMRKQVDDLNKRVAMLERIVHRPWQRNATMDVGIQCELLIDNVSQSDETRMSANPLRDRDSAEKSSTNLCENAENETPQVISNTLDDGSIVEFISTDEQSETYTRTFPNLTLAGSVSYLILDLPPPNAPHTDDQTTLNPYLTPKGKARINKQRKEQEKKKSKEQEKKKSKEQEKKKSKEQEKKKSKEQKKEEGRKPFWQSRNCPNCNALFTSRTAYSRHKRTCKMGNNNLRLKCDFCDKSFKRRDNLQRHWDSLHKHRRYEKLPGEIVKREKSVLPRKSPEKSKQIILETLV